ncbi:unnamed protein product [Durusdinium trenchii]|uniref:Uncharacterized protein n=1 Tax=Durusdinium trenchii TaxID=1381693 RepID=A0ABP0I2Y6_9DINO
MNFGDMGGDEYDSDDEDLPDLDPAEQPLGEGVPRVNLTEASLNDMAASVRRFHPNLDTGLNIRVNRITRDRKEEEIESEKKKLMEKGEVDKAEKLESKRPLHVNNVCHVAEERTIIQSSDGSRKDKLKKGEESFSVDEYSMFKQDNKAILDKFANADWELSEALCKECPTQAQAWGALGCNLDDRSIGSVASNSLP